MNTKPSSQVIYKKGKLSFTTSNHILIDEIESHHLLLLDTPEYLVNNLGSDDFGKFLISNIDVGADVSIGFIVSDDVSDIVNTEQIRKQVVHKISGTFNHDGTEISINDKSLFKELINAVESLKTPYIYLEMVSN